MPQIRAAASGGFCRTRRNTGHEQPRRLLRQDRPAERQPEERPGQPAQDLHAAGRPRHGAQRRIA